MALTVPWSFGSAGANTPTTQLDQDFSAVADYVNARNATIGPISSRPLPGNAGAIWISSDESNKVYVDDGTAWVAVSTGVSVGRHMPLLIEQATFPDGTGTGNAPAVLARSVSVDAQTANTPKVTFTYAAFDPTTDQHLMWLRILPADYLSGGTLRLKWTGVVGGNVVWKASVRVFVDGVVTGGTPPRAYEAPTLVTQANLSEMNQTLIALPTTNFAANRLVLIFLGRDADNAADTSANIASLWTVQFEYLT